MTGTSYTQRKDEKRVSFESDKDSLKEYCHNIISQTKPDAAVSKEYKASDAMLMARRIEDINTKVTTQGASFAQVFLLKKGLKVFGQKGHDASVKEIDQLHRRNCFTPVLVTEMSPTERRKAQQALMFLTEKRDTSVKGRMVYNGKPTHEWMGREDSASPTAALESIMLTAVILSLIHI